MRPRSSVAAIILLLIIAAGIYLFLPTIRAHRLLSQVATLQVGKSTFDAAQKLAAAIGATPSNPCTAADCNWYRSIDNSALPEKWIGTGASLSASFRVQNSVVTERGITFKNGAVTDTTSFADIEERSHWYGAPPNPVSIQTQWTAHVPRYSVFDLMTPVIPSDTRSRYLSFNLSCLWKYGGCTDAQQFLPTVDWEE